MQDKGKKAPNAELIKLSARLQIFFSDKEEAKKPVDEWRRVKFLWFRVKSYYTAPITKFINSFVILLE